MTGWRMFDEMAMYGRSVNGLTFEPAAVATESGLDVGHGYRGIEIHYHRDENEDCRRAPGPYRVIEEQSFGLNISVRTVVYMVMYQWPRFDAHHVQPEKGGHEGELDDECWKRYRPHGLLISTSVIFKERTVTASNNILYRRNYNDL